MTSQAWVENASCASEQSSTVQDNAVTGVSNCSGSAFTANGVTPIGSLVLHTVSLVHTVTYFANGGDGSMNSQSASLITDLTTNGFTRTDYTFAGWSTVAGVGVVTYEDGASYLFTGNLDLYAQWTADTYVISYNINEATGGTVPADQTKTYEVALTLQANSGSLEKTNYSFAGWNTAADGTGTNYAVGSTYSIDAADELFAQWTADTYTVTFDSQLGSVVTAQTTVSVSSSPSTTRSGYMFQGWFTATSGGTAITYSYAITGDITLYAQWLSATLETPENLAASATSDTLKSIDVSWDAVANASGYSLRIYNASGGLLDTIALASDLTTYTITSASGSFENIADGITYKISLTASGDGNYANSNESAKVSVTTIASYIISFNANSATSGTVPADQTKTHDVDLALATNSGTLVKTGYRFDGWNTQADGEGTPYAVGSTYAADTDVQLFARWLEAHTVTFDSQLGSAVTTKTTVSVSSSPSTTRSGYTFLGWFEAASGGTGISVPYWPSDDMTLYAQWLLTASPPADNTVNSAPAPLDASAPAPTPPNGTVRVPGGFVAGSNESLRAVSNWADRSMMVSGSDWQMRVTSSQKNGESKPADKDMRLVFQPRGNLQLAAAGLMPNSTVSFWLFSEPTKIGEAQTDSTGGLDSDLELPEGILPGEHTLQLLSRDSSGRAVTLNFPVLVAGDAVSTAVTSNQKVNAGSFKGYVAIYAKGYKGQRLSAKVGRDWVIVPSIPSATNNLYRYVEYAGAGVDCAVRIYIDYALISTIRLTTK